MFTCRFQFPSRDSAAHTEVVGYPKGKSAIAVAGQFGGKKKNFHGEKLWARDYAPSTVSFNVAEIKANIRNQDQLDSQRKE